MTRLPVLLTTGEVAAALGVDPATVRRWIKLGKLAAIRTPSGQARVRQDTVDTLLQTPAVPAQRDAESVPA